MNTTLIFTANPKSAMLLEKSLSLFDPKWKMEIPDPIEIILVTTNSEDEHLVSRLYDWQRILSIYLKNKLFRDIEVFINIKPVSSGEAKCSALSLSHGDWIIYLDCGQILEINRFSKLISTIDNFYSKADVIFGAYTLYRSEKDNGVSYFPSIWRGREQEIINRNMSLANFIGISHKRSIGFEFTSELDFCQNMLTHNKQFAYTDFINGHTELDLINGNYNSN
jgi:hypothetical protein